MDAVESGITKIPRLPAIDNTGRPDPKYFKLWEHITRDLKAGEKLTDGKPKPEVIYRKAEDALLTLASEWKQKFDQVISSYAASAGCASLQDITEVQEKKGANWFPSVESRSDKSLS